MKKNRIELSIEQREDLEKFSTTGTHNVRLVNRAKTILLSDTSEGRKPAKQGEIALKLDISEQTVCKIKREFRETNSISDLLERKKRSTPPVAPKITGEVEARIIALACSEPPEGAAKWTLNLLADKSVELNIVDSISHMSVHRLLKNGT